MAQQQRPSEREQHEERYEGNGLARDIQQEARGMKQEIERGSKELERRYGFSPEVQGYILMTAGSVLLLFSLGLFPILKWAMVATSVGIIAIGVYRSDFIRSIAHSFEGMRKRR